MTALSERPGYDDGRVVIATAGVGLAQVAVDRTDQPAEALAVEVVLAAQVQHLGLGDALATRRLWATRT